MKKYKINTSFIYLIILISCSVITNAQHNHGNHGASHDVHLKESPHGGDLNEIGKYKIELVTNLYLKENNFMLYLFKRNLKPLSNKGITGTIIINYKDDTSSFVSLKPKGTEFFVAQLQNTEFFSCIVSITIKGKTFSTIFYNKELEDNATNNYSCPMHPEIKSEVSGACPKCGMKLEKQ